MKRKNKKVLLVILSAVLLQSGTNILPVLAINTTISLNESRENISLEEKCTARYNSIRINWNGETNHIYKIETSDFQDGPFSIIAEDLNSSEYIHENVGVGQKKYYRVTDQTIDKVTAVFSNDTYTGLKALNDNAKLKWNDDLSNRHVFNGTNVINVDSQISNVNTLTGGTIIVKGSFNGAETWKQNASILGINDSGIFGIRHANSNNQTAESFGLDFSGGLKATYPNTDFQNDTHVAVYSNPPSDKAGKIIASFNGGSTVSFDNNDTLKGLFTRFGGVNTLSIGGNRNSNGTIVNPWYGTIDYVIVTDEILSQSEINAISNDAPEINIEESDTLTVSIDSKYDSNIITWNAVKGVSSYTVLARDDTNSDFIPLVTTGGLRYVDNALSTNNREYKVVAGNQESEILVAKNGLQSGIIYKEFGEEGKLDGNSCIDILDNDQTLLNKLRAMDEGSIIMKFRFNNSNTPRILFSTKNKALETPDYASSGSNNGKDMISLYLKENNELRSDLKHTRATAVGYALSSDNWHTLVFSNSKDSVNGKQLRVTLDGKEIQEFHGNSANVGLFNLTPTIDQITLGGILESDGSVLYGLDGQISYISILDEVLSDQKAIDLTSETKNKIDDLFDNGAFNTWVVTGGPLAQGSLQDIGGVRNYTGLFEEVIRWNLGSASMEKRQRFVINTANKMQNIEGIDLNYDSLIKSYQPKALALMLDNNQSLSDLEIQDHLLSIFNKNNGNNIYSVIQIPPALDDSSLRIANNVDKVLSKLDSSTLKNIMVINHDNLFKSEFGDISDKFNSNGSLNAKGHLVLANQLSLKTANRTTTINENNILKPTKMIPSFISDVPDVLISDYQLDIEVPNNDNISNYSYKLNIDDIMISGNFIGTKAVIKNLPKNKKFELIVQGNDGNIQLKTLVGKTDEGTKATVKLDNQELTELQKGIYSKVQQDKSMKWLFLGDSITHGALHTNGYDALPQVFEKFIKNDLNRNNDVIINTGVSSATVQELMNNKEARYDRYKDADVVVLMFGTNDAFYSDDPTSYRQNLKAIISEIKENNSIPVLRTPNKLFSNDNRGARLLKYVEVIREVAKEENCILVDHYQQWEDAAYINNRIGKAYGDWMNTDDIHPNHLGQLKMAQLMIKEMGLWNSESMTCNLDYETSITKEVSQIVPSVTLNNKTLTVDINKLSHDYGQSFGKVTVEANIDGVIYSKIVKKDSLEPITIVELTDLPKGSDTINVTVKASLDSSNMEIAFKEQEIKNELDKDILIEKINYAKIFSKHEYTSESFNNLTNVINDAQQILETAHTQSEIDEAVNLLDLAIKSLVKINTNKIALEIAIEIADKVTDRDLENVVPVVVTEFKAALEEAKSVLADVSASQEKIDESFSRLAKVIQMLEFYKGDKTQLINLVNKIEALNKNDYTNESWTNLQPVLDEAKFVLNNENALEKEVTEAHDKLVRAFLQLRLKPNKDLLNELIEQIERLNAIYYTPSSWDRLQGALTEAKSVLVDENATNVEVNNAIVIMKEAIAGLKTNFDESKSITNKNDLNKQNIVKTGDILNIIYPISMMMLALIILYKNIIIKKE